MTAAQNHSHRTSVPVARSLMQRSHTYNTFTEAYHTSEMQEEVRRAQARNLKSTDCLKTYLYGGNQRDKAN